MDNFVLNCKEVLIAHLEATLSNINTLSDVGSLPEKVQQKTEFICKDIIYKNPQMFFCGFDLDSKFRDYIIDIDSNIFTVAFAQNLHNYSELFIAILCQNRQGVNEKLVVHTVDINGYGRYKKIRIELSDKLILKGSNFLVVIKCLFETSYEWFGLKVEEFVKKRTVSVAYNVYKYMRKVLCNDTLYKSFWLAVIGKGYGFRLVNTEQVVHLFNTFERSDFGELSVNSFVGNLISTKLPYDELLMKVALDYDQKIDGDISIARYTQRGDIYSKTMYALYNGNAFSVYPLAQGDIGIVALYPVEFKEAIEPQLNYTRNSIVNVIRRELTNIELAYLLFDDNYQEDFNSGLPYSFGHTDSKLVYDVLDACFELLEKYYKIYQMFGQGFVIDNVHGYCNDDVQQRLVLEQNGLLTRNKNGFCISEKGITLFVERIKRGTGMDMSNNSGVINLGIMENVQNKTNTIPGISCEVTQLMENIKSACRDTDEQEYVNTLLHLLEKEIEKNEPKSNVLKTILSGLASISTISSFAIKLGEVLKIRL